MIFVVIAHGIQNLNFDDEKTADAAVRSHRYRDKLVAEGKIIVHGHIVGHKGHLWVYDVDDIDELDRIITSDPMYPWIQHDPTMYMVISEERAQELEQQFFSDTLAKEGE